VGATTIPRRRSKVHIWSGAAPVPRMGRCSTAAVSLLVALRLSLAAADELVHGDKHNKFPGLNLDNVPMAGFASFFDSEESVATSPIAERPQLALLKQSSKTNITKVAFVSVNVNATPGVSSSTARTGAKRKHKALDFLEESSATEEQVEQQASRIVVDDVSDKMDSQLGAPRLALLQQQPHPLASGGSWFSILRLTISFTLMIKSLAILSNVVMHISPFPIVKEIEKLECTGDKDSAPFVSIAYCSSQSAFYGLYAYWVTSRSGFLVLCYSNVVGVSMGMYYVYTFLGNCKNVDIMSLTRNYLKAAAFLVSIQAIAILALPAPRSLFFVGLTSSMCSLISAFSLITSVPEVLRTKCSKNLPVPVLISGAASAFFWFLCGVDLWDPYIAAPNGIYVLIAGCALSLAAYYPREEKGGKDFDPLFADPSSIGGKYPKADFYGSTGGSWDC